MIIKLHQSTINEWLLQLIMRDERHKQTTMCHIPMLDSSVFQCNRKKEILRFSSKQIINEIPHEISLQRSWNSPLWLWQLFNKAHVLCHIFFREIFLSASDVQRISLSGCWHRFLRLRLQFYELCWHEKIFCSVTFFDSCTFLTFIKIFLWKETIFVIILVVVSPMDSFEEIMIRKTIMSRSIEFPWNFRHRLFTLRMWKIHSFLLQSIDMISFRYKYFSGNDFPLLFLK